MTPNCWSRSSKKESDSMNLKEIGEIRRRQRRDRSNMSAIYGCYVRDDKEIISEFKASMAMLPENEADKYMSLFKKTLGGSLGKTLKDISFATRQVANREARYAALMDLRQDQLKDEAKRKAFYQTVIEALHLDCNHLILLGCETYDVPFKSKDDEAQSDASDESFTYFLCSVCPVKETKPNLHYVHTESTFHDGGMIQAVNAPTLGFMFPAFDDRSTNLYGALYYSKDTSDAHEAFVEAVFGTQPPRPADAEKAAFDNLLRTSLGDECSIETIQSIHDQASSRVELHKESKIPEPLTVNKDEMRSVLRSSGVTEEAANKFAEAFTEAFGAGAQVPLQNIVDTKHYTVKAPDVVIKIAPEKAHNIEMRTIGGLNYIMVLADGDVEVNGVQLATPGNN